MRDESAGPKFLSLFNPDDGEVSLIISGCPTETVASQSTGGRMKTPKQEEMNELVEKLHELVRERKRCESEAEDTAAKAKEAQEALRVVRLRIELIQAEMRDDPVAANKIRHEMSQIEFWRAADSKLITMVENRT